MYKPAQLINVCEDRAHVCTFLIHDVIVMQTCHYHAYCVGCAVACWLAAENASIAYKHQPIVWDQGVGATNKWHFWTRDGLRIPFLVFFMVNGEFFTKLQIFVLHFQYDNFHFFNWKCSENMLRLSRYQFVKKKQESDKRGENYQRILQTVYLFRGYFSTPAK